MNCDWEFSRPVGDRFEHRCRACGSVRISKYADPKMIRARCEARPDAWTAGPPDGPQHIASPPPPLRPDDLPCPHRGENIRERINRLTGGKKIGDPASDAYECDIYGRCTLTYRRCGCAICLTCSTRPAPTA